MAGRKKEKKERITINVILSGIRPELIM